jgi:hypothetical protein
MKSRARTFGSTPGNLLASSPGAVRSRLMSE